MFAGALYPQLFNVCSGRTNLGLMLVFMGQFAHQFKMFHTRLSHSLTPHPNILQSRYASLHTGRVRYMPRACILTIELDDPTA